MSDQWVWRESSASWEGVRLKAPGAKVYEGHCGRVSVVLWQGNHRTRYSPHTWYARAFATDFAPRKELPVQSGTTPQGAVEAAIKYLRGRAGRGRRAYINEALAVLTMPDGIETLTVKQIPYPVKMCIECPGLTDDDEDVGAECAFTRQHIADYYKMPMHCPLWCGGEVVLRKAKI